MKGRSILFTAKITLAAISQVAAVYSHILAIKSDKTLWALGWKTYDPVSPGAAPRLRDTLCILEFT